MQNDARSTKTVLQVVSHDAAQNSGQNPGQNPGQNRPKNAPRAAGAIRFGQVITAFAVIGTVMFSLASQREAGRAEVRAACATAQQRAWLAYDMRLQEAAGEKGWEIRHTTETIIGALRQETVAACRAFGAERSAE